MFFFILFPDRINLFCTFHFTTIPLFIYFLHIEVSFYLKQLKAVRIGRTECGYKKGPLHMDALHPVLQTKSWLVKWMDGQGFRKAGDGLKGVRVMKGAGSQNWLIEVI